jgi:hypothetical protein
MRKHSFIVTDVDVPPLNHEIGKHTQCGWCNATIGQEHDADCVCRKRTVVARLTFEFVTAIPEHWDEAQFESVHNGNKMCASNHLDKLTEQDACVCGGLTYVREATERDEKLLRHTFWWDK